jgi:hypothetical protein
MPRPETHSHSRDPRFRLSQITWRTTVAHHPTEDKVAQMATSFWQRVAARVCGNGLRQVSSDSVLSR